ncbi:acetyl-CoA carboxylase biotin carboxylase subunit [Acuticoccus sp. I52.16.1]|uniref:acetyl-CoA carboxylase biotin carboxylase subunit n=1 Tax=Acuticoccus sp. I52.16.1 TaxID=2928472 RepID=UPI001FD18F7B|nr:acetyl-CoA carboxylase biotin carboxylase subunit [Acuticoccus sp. I52.16.1]UOM35484.1 acetyl-CoA carboxylase biotin carboxylase subunit [Acuticoccus sp. I52.16.1]
MSAPGDLSGKTLFVANRGEIAVRIVRAAKALGLRTVQAHSDADADMLAVRLADAAVSVGPPQAAKSYLNIERVVAAAQEAGADAVHPGYGFLAENATFAAAVEAAGMIFVGPSAETIAKMGDKVAARNAARAANVPITPGSEGRLDGLDAARAVAGEIGFPLMIKAAAGGGGRGIRVAHDRDELARLVPQAEAEARAAFGDGGLYIERFVPRARHIEVQVLGDGTRAVHLFERECSLQRRRQKVWEEAPSASLSPQEREEICAASVRLAEAAAYKGAGTLEYLFDDEERRFSFLEMNTRIQVEHPVTEAITGIDLVAEMIRIAFGAPLRLAQEDIAITGHAIEVRINAEDPAKDFMPFPGVCGAIHVPADVRFDTLLYEGYQIPPFYDSLLGKLVVHGASRMEAITLLREALARTGFEGLVTTLALHEALAAEGDVIGNRIHTNWLEEWLATKPFEATS